MKKYFKRGIALLIAVIISISLCGCAESDDLPKPTKEFFVNDFADIITKENEQKIIAQAAALQEKTKAQAVVVTVNSLDGEPIEEYALKIGREWGVGDEEKDNGIVILLSKQDREIYIAVGYGLEGALPDSKIGRIIDQYGSEHFKVDDFSTGTAKIYESIVNEIYIEYGHEVTEGYTPVLELPAVETQNESASAVEVLLSWIALIAIVVLYVTVFGRRGGLFIFGAPRFFGGFHHHGGFGGSSGGFGGFKGGGGSFGGGGAGRKF